MLLLYINLWFIKSCLLLWSSEINQVREVVYVSLVLLVFFKCLNSSSGGPTLPVLCSTLPHLPVNTVMQILAAWQAAVWRTTLMQEKNILTVYTFLVLMIEEIKYSIKKKKSVVSNVMKERMTYLSYYICNFSFEKTAKENGRLM